MPGLREGGPQPSRDLIQALSQTHRDIRSVCKDLGFDPASLERVIAHSEMLALPWSQTLARRAKDASEILKDKIPPDLAMADAEEVLLVRHANGETSCPGLMGAVLALRDDNWSRPGKVAFARIIATEPSGYLEQAFLFTNSDEEVLAICQVAICWVVYNAMVEASLLKCQLPPGSREVLSALQEYAVNLLALTYHNDLQEGTLDGHHPCARLEETLHKLAIARPETGAVVGRILTQWGSALSHPANGPESILSSRLESAIAEPEGSVTGETDGGKLAAIAKAYQLNVEKNLALASHFRPLTEQPEWSDPLYSLAKMADQGLVRTNLQAANFWTSEKVVELFRVTASHMKTPPHLVISSQELELASIDSSSIVDIVDALNSLIRTGQKSMAETGTVAPAQCEAMKNCISFLGEMRSIFGPDHIHIVVHNRLDTFLRDREVTGFLLASTERGGDDLLDVSVKLYPSNDLDHDYLTKVRERLQYFLRDLPFMAAPEVVLLAQGLVPFLAQRKGGDPLGFVGFSPLTALDLANERFLERPLSFTSPQNPQALRITLVKDSEEENADTPTEDVHTDTPLEPAGLSSR